MRSVRLGLLTAVLMTPLIAGAAAEFRIAVVGPMSGTLSMLGRQIADGASAAVAAINQAGGVLGEELVLDIVDDACAEDRADALANQLAGAGVVLVVGHLCSAPAIAAAEVYAAEGIIQIAPGAPDPRFTDERPGPGVFRMFGRSDHQAIVAGAFLADLPEENRIAVIDDLSPYGVRLADAVEAHLTEAGRPPALVRSYSVAEAGFAELVSLLIGSGIEAVFVGGNATDIAALRLEMAARDYRPLLIGGDVLALPVFGEIAGAEADGVLFTYQPDPRAEPTATDAVAAIEEAGGNAGGFALYAYAAVEVWAAAAEAAGTAVYAAVADALAAVTFDTALGEVGFADNGDFTLPGWVLYQWQEGAYVPLAP